MLGKPVHERQIVGQAAQKGHGRMGMGVDEAGQNKHVAEIQFARALPEGGDIRAGTQGDDDAFVYGQSSVFDRGAFRILCDDAGGVQQEIAGRGHGRLPCVECGRKSDAGSLGASIGKRAPARKIAEVWSYGTFLSAAARFGRNAF